MERVLQSLMRLPALVLDASGVEELLDDVTHLAADVVVPPADASITVLGDAQPATISASSEHTMEIDEIQYSERNGPCLESIDTGARVDVPRLREDERWPQWRDRAIAAGVESVVAAPMSVDAKPFGALNLYSSEPEHFAESEVKQVEVFAALAAGAFTVVHRLGLQERNLKDLEQALESRTTIDHAIGILMAEQRCSAGAAMDLLRQHSSNTNRKLRDVAGELVSRFEHQPSGPSSFERRR